jgi:hypothetical protein
MNSFAFVIALAASGCVSGRDLLLDFAPQGAAGDVEIVARL